VIADDAMSELRAICGGAQEMVEAAITYVYLPKLKLSCVPAALDGLLCIQAALRLCNSIVLIGPGAREG